MEKVTLNVELRDSKGKGPARSLRRSGRIPGVIYGQGGSTAISMNRKELIKIIVAAAGGSTLLSVTVPGGKGEKMAILKDYQLDPVKNELLHADLLEVAMGKAIHVTVPVMLTGDAPAGIKEGGILQHPTREILVECLPGNIPAHIDIDASGLKIGDSIHVGDLKLPEGVKALTEHETVIAAIAAPISTEKLDQMLSTEASAEVKEPEVLTKKKEEEQ
ncbi:MAG: 50S ribosomal protein L25/general stress protein Ctc [Nitrospirota bacterium]